MNLKPLIFTIGNFYTMYFARAGEYPYMHFSESLNHYIPISADPTMPIWICVGTAALNILLCNDHAKAVIPDDDVPFLVILGTITLLSVICTFIPYPYNPQG